MKISNVSKAYEAEKVLDDISLAIEKGKITAFIGPNGAGKSTLLSVISRLLTKDEGILTIHGKEIEAWQSDELAKELSILKQQNTYQVRMTVRELVSFGRFPYTKGRLNEEDHAMIDKVLGYLKPGGILQPLFGYVVWGATPAGGHRDDLGAGHRVHLVG